MPTTAQLFRRVGLLYIAIASEPETPPARRATPAPKGQFAPRDCVWCGREFVPTQPRHALCSKPCKRRRDTWPRDMAPALRKGRAIVDNSSTRRVV